MALIIRPRIESDIDALVTVLAESHRSDSYPVMAEHVSGAWLTEKGDPAWVAELDGVVVGHAAVAGKPAGSLELTRLVVSSSARGAGVATCLLDVVEQHAEAVGSPLFLDVLEYNSNAMRLYERRGWHPTFSERVDWFGADGPQPLMHRYVKQPDKAQSM
ncbi:MAG TPA: GNAT family N-acetyltransferase [Humibacter sp.]|nr:GNAT family N-acetyltransferase [Humibacter sp.]